MEISAQDARLQFIGLARDEAAQLAPISDKVEALIASALAVFYARLDNEPEVAKLFSSKASVERAQARQTTHWQSLARGQFDEAYFARGKVIGDIHAKIGLEPRWYMGGYALILEHLLIGLLEEDEPNFWHKRGTRLAQKGATRGAIGAFAKAIVLDMEISVSTYFDQISAETARLNGALGDVVASATNGVFDKRIEANYANDDLNRLAERVNGLMAVIGTQLASNGAALEALARADLSQRPNYAAEGAFAQLRDNIDHVAVNLTSIVDELRENSSQLKSTTAELVSGTSDLSARTTQQSAAVEEIATTIGGAFERLDQCAQQADRAESGTIGVLNDVAKAEAVMSQATDAMVDIGTASRQIGSIIDLIDTIAFQTNLLALNASVEAARAGDAGNGFAVVAQEVRRLAQSAAEASKKVGGLVEQCMSIVDHGTGVVGSAAEQLGTIADGVRKSSHDTTAIAVATRELLGTLGEVNRAVQQIDQMTQHNAALVEQTNVALEQTEARAKGLDAIVDVFKVESLKHPARAMVGGF